MSIKKIIVADETGRGYSEVPTITLAPTGILSISPAAIKKIGLIETDKIVLARDGDVLIAKAVGKKNLHCYEVKKMPAGKKFRLIFSRKTLITVEKIDAAVYRLEEVIPHDKTSVPGKEIAWFKLIKYRETGKRKKKS